MYLAISHHPRSVCTQENPTNPRQNNPPPTPIKKISIARNIRLSPKTKQTPPPSSFVFWKTWAAVLAGWCWGWYPPCMVCNMADFYVNTIITVFSIRRFINMAAFMTLPPENAYFLSFSASSAISNHGGRNDTKPWQFQKPCKPF